MDDFFREFLLPFFHEGLGSPSPNYRDAATEGLVGDVPYVNGGIFEPHPLERSHDIRIPDASFEELFEFFGQWRWHLDERPSGDPKEINPDVLGFIFEQYINQKQQGAYYTKPDVTGYMTAATVVPAVVDRLVAAGLEDPCVLLPQSGDAYLHDSLGYGREVEPPEQTPPAEAPDPGLDIALPGERWCEVLHRRERYRTQRTLLNDGGVRDIDGAITENLDLRTLIDDYLRTLGSVSEVQQAFDVLRSLTVCDPTVGSGAFLFAALDVLDDMYTAVLERADELESKGRGTPPFLDEARAHVGERYWLLKTICLHNLYGVDLMAEAGEITKLRLFLKLAAQLDDASQMEPLPDLDFNIKPGNLLVGIADADDAERRFGGGALPFDHLQRVKDEAERIASAYEEFTETQTGVRGGAAGVDAKRHLIDRFEAVREIADNELFRLRGEVGDFEEWRTSHRPFHWFIEFPSVWRHRGFDVIVGNPPYIGMTGNRRDRLGYTWQGYETGRCPDIYAICVERAASLLNDHGRFSMIVMHSLCFAKGFEPLRAHLLRSFASMWVSSYSRIPDGLFSGSARVRNSIVVADRTGHRGLTTSRCRRWLTGSRPIMLPTQQYIKPVSGLLTAGPVPQWPFLDDTDVAATFAQLVDTQPRLGRAFEKQPGYSLTYKTVAQYALGIYIDEPPAYDALNRRVPLTKTGTLHFITEPARDVAFIVLSSIWVYLWWAAYGDEFDVTRGVLGSFPADPVTLAQGRPVGMKLQRLAAELRAELPRYLRFKQNAGIRVGRYDLRECDHITDEADWLLAQAWGLTRDQYEAAGSLRHRMTFGQRD